MGSILKALGLTVWGLAAIGLLAILVFVGYETAMKHRTLSDKPIVGNTSRDPSEPGQLGPTAGTSDSDPANRAAGIPHTSVPSRTPVAIRQLLVDGAQSGNSQSAIANGQQLADEKFAEPGDCVNARPWAQKAQSEPALANYELAIASIERGLSKGGVVHLAEAYVYLGLAKQRVGDIEGAREAFSKLKSVPGISPRVLKLWTLYAETQLTGSGNWECRKAAPADRNSNSNSTTELPEAGR